MSFRSVSFAGYLPSLFRSQLAPRRTVHGLSRRLLSSLESPLPSPPRPAGVNLGLGFPATRGFVFDMDGTMVAPSIDFADMRARIEIPRGDLFTQMEMWEDKRRIADALRVIEEIEAQATASGNLVAADGLYRALNVLKDAGFKVGLVTRNTMASVRAFFELLGDEEFVTLFSPVLTREFRHVKPDKRIIQHISDVWCIHPSEIVMIGDSKEDVEVGNAGGAMSCLVLGGGNEVSQTQMKEGRPSLTVSGLAELADIVEQGLANPQPANANPAPLRRGPTKPLEMDFIDALFAARYLRAAFCTFPRLTAAFGCEDVSTYSGDKVVHFACGDGYLTKLFGSLGIALMGTDDGISSTLLPLASARGLPIATLSSLSDSSFDAAIGFVEELLVVPAWARSIESLREAIARMARPVRNGGTVSIELPVRGNATHVVEHDCSMVDGVADVSRAGEEAGLRVLEATTMERDSEFGDVASLRAELELEARRVGAEGARVVGDGDGTVHLRRARVVFAKGW